MSQHTSDSSTILVVHGALGSGAHLQSMANALGTLGRVVLVELPGHGRTPLAAGQAFAMGTFAQILAAAATEARMRDGAGARAPVVFGYSMGGYAALLAESLTPGTVSGIVTLGTKFEWTPAVGERAAAGLHAPTIAEKVPKFAAALAERHLEAGGWELMMQRTAALVRDLGEGPSLTTELLGRVHCPVLVAVGTGDDTTDIDESARAAACMPRAEFVPLEGLPHPIERVPSDVVVGLVQRLISSD